MLKYSTPGGNGASLNELVNRLRAKIGPPGLLAVVAIQEAGLDGFWAHRLLEANGIESYVVDAASIAVPRRRRRARTDAIDGETLLRTLLAWKRGEPRVCAMDVPPTPEQEDRRRTSRERAALMRERTRHVNQVKGSRGRPGHPRLRASTKRSPCPLGSIEDVRRQASAASVPHERTRYRACEVRGVGARQPGKGGDHR
jgi:transposase